MFPLSHRLQAGLYALVAATGWVALGLCHAGWLVTWVCGILTLFVCWQVYMAYQVRHLDWWPPWDDGLPQTMRMANVFVPVAIWWTLAALLLPVFVMVRHTAQHTATRAVAHHLADALFAYASDHDGRLPRVVSGAPLRSALAPYSTSEEVSQAMKSLGRFTTNPQLAGKGITEGADGSNTPLLYQMSPEPDGTRVVTFADGRTRAVSGTEWRRVCPR